MRGILYAIINMFLLLGSQKNPKPKPKRLGKQEESKKFQLDLNVTNLIIICAGISLFIISALIVFRYGALESTHVYNNLSGRI